MKTRKKSRPGPLTSKSGADGARRSRSLDEKPTGSKRRKPVYTLKEERSHRFRALSFPEAVGKKAAKVELVTSDELHAVVVVFDDNTAVGFEFEPCFRVQAFGEDINAIGGKGSKNWPKILSES